MEREDELIVGVRLLAGDYRLYRRERLEKLAKIKEELDRQIEWMKAKPHGGLEPALAEG